MSLRYKLLYNDDKNLIYLTNSELDGNILFKSASLFNNFYKGLAISMLTVGGLVAYFQQSIVHPIL